MHLIFGERLKELRQERNLGIVELAKHLEVRHSTISKWENGKLDPKLSSLLAIVKYFEVTMDFLVGLTDY